MYEMRNFNNFMQLNLNLRIMYIKFKSNYEFFFRLNIITKPNDFFLEIKKLKVIKSFADERWQTKEKKCPFLFFFAPIN
jgi:hypothetical protein